MPCAHFAGLTERFAREIEAVKTQYPFEDRKIQCAMIGLDTNRFSFLAYETIPIKGSFVSPVFKMDLGSFYLHLSICCRI